MLRFSSSNLVHLTQIRALASSSARLSRSKYYNSGNIKKKYKSYSRKPSEPSEIILPNIRSKLDYFIQTGDTAPFPFARNKLKKTRSGEPRKQKVNVIYELNLKQRLRDLRNKFDSGMFINPDGSFLDVFKIGYHDLKPNNPKSRVIFDNIMRIKKVSKMYIDRDLILLLLGTTEHQLKDSYYISKNILSLLEWDNDTERALLLARKAEKAAAIVGMNIILKWHFDRGQIKEAIRSFYNRSKWGIVPNSQTYIILFDGLSKNHSWGNATDGLCEDMVNQFDKYREQYSKPLKQTHRKSVELFKQNSCTINHFNALLGLLLKNFNEDQKIAWEFFDKIIPDPGSTLIPLIADCQTYTIFIDGIQKFSMHKAQEVVNSKSLSSNEKEIKLLEIQAKLIQVAELILKKVLVDATPPEPPTREEAIENPGLLAEYKHKSGRILIDIEPVFVNVFLGSYINAIGNGTSLNGGCHYIYVRQGLEYLRFWCKEIDSILDCASKKNDKDLEYITKAIKPIINNTNNRVDKAIQAFENSNKKLDNDVPITSILPSSVCPELPIRDKVNPLVKFPPPLDSKNKTRATFSGVEKRLVDLSRRTSEEERMIAKDKSFLLSNGKYGNKMTEAQKQSLSIKRIGINKFILQRLVDGLFYLGRYREAHTSIWYILSNWGGIYVPEIKSGLESVYSPIYLPKFTMDKKEMEEVKSIKRIPAPYNKDVVDIISIENFIYKINENVKTGGIASTSLVTEIFGALVSPVTNVNKYIYPRFKTIDAMFSCFMKDLFYYGDYNYNNSLKENNNNASSSTTGNKTIHKSITKDQLTTYLKALNSFMNSLLVFRNNNDKNRLLQTSDIESYNRIIERIYESEWLNTTKEDFEIHKLILQSGILFYKPKALRKIGGEDYKSSDIGTSINFVYSHIKNHEDLHKSELGLLRALVPLLKIRNYRDNDKLEEIVSNIYHKVAKSCT
ncbi:uncharacterized protein RJT21DRAFT_110891 [Scheffersomyces amazonensis]|uniref:uncharacterized protein n=1 Tax=Scheffersomyces amazonensis TaxID=1078765 RepID=UPI00315D90F3